MPAQPVNKWLVAVSIAFGSLMATIDSSIVNVALPHDPRRARRELQEITWISTGVHDRDGARHAADGLPRRRSSARSASTSRRWSLFVARLGAVRHRALARRCSSLWRILQGLGGGALQPTQQAILRQTFPPEEQGMAMALFSMVIMVGPAVGPVLGGYITDNYAGRGSSTSTCRSASSAS